MQSFKIQNLRYLREGTMVLMMFGCNLCLKEIYQMKTFFSVRRKEGKHRSMVCNSEHSTAALVFVSENWFNRYITTTNNTYQQSSLQYIGHAQTTLASVLLIGFRSCVSVRSGLLTKNQDWFNQNTIHTKNQ